MRYALIVLFLAGCSHLRPARPTFGAKLAASPEHCAKLARDSEIQHIFAILLSGAGTGGAGIAPVITNKIAQDSILGVAAACSLTGAVLSYTGGLAAASYSKDCP